MKKTLLNILILFLVSNTLSAQNQTDSLFKCNLCVNGIHTNKNPYNLKFKREIPFIAAGLGLLGTSIMLSQNNNTQAFTIAELNNLNKNNINKFDRFATNNQSNFAQNASNYLAFSSLALPVLFLTEHYTRSDFLNLVLMGLEVGTINTGITDIVKNLVNRPRPYTYNNQVSYATRMDKQSKLSFFSGHTSTTTAYSFFFAKVITDYHPNMKKGYRIGFWSFAAIIPATTAYFRVAAGKHYPSDVITGYAVGALVGWLVPELHKKKQIRKVNFTLLPYNFNNANGLSLNVKF